MSRGVVLVTLLGGWITAGLASAQPSMTPPPPPPPPGTATPAVEDAGSPFKLRAGAGFAHYAEHVQGLEFVADYQPFIQVTAEAGMRAGKGRVVLQVAGGVGTEVDMHASQGGMITQQNRFWQELYEASPRIHWPINPRLHFDGGYRLTVQRLHIIKIPTLGDALEVVTVHALEGGIGWERHDLGGGGLAFDLSIGLNRGSADNDRIEGESFSAGGFSLTSRLTKTYPSGLTLDAHFQMRKQTGSSVQHVTFDGMETDAVWPSNTTTILLAAAGYRF